MEGIYQIVILLLLCCAVGCTRGPDSQLPVKDLNSGKKAKVIPLQQLDTAGQLKQARIFLMKLKTAIVNNDQPRLLNMIHFPMQTQMMWLNESQAIDEKGGLLSRDEFPEYYRKNFFDKEQRRVLGYEQGDDVYPVNLQSDQSSNYYQRLSRGTDPGTLLFNYYLQWERPDGRGDYWFGLVVGQIKGEFKLLSYYSKWPVKD